MTEVWEKGEGDGRNDDDEQDEETMMKEHERFSTERRMRGEWEEGGTLDGPRGKAWTGKRGGEREERKERRERRIYK